MLLRYFSLDCGDNDDGCDNDDNDDEDDEQGIRHLGMSPCASENLTVLELDNCPLITDLRFFYTTADGCDDDSGYRLIKNQDGLLSPRLLLKSSELDQYRKIAE